MSKLSSIHCRNSAAAVAGLVVAVATGLLLPSCIEDKRSAITDEREIVILSYLVRDRVVPLDRLEMRSTIIVGYRIVPPPGLTEANSVKARLYLDDKKIAEDLVSVVDGPTGNVAFNIYVPHGNLQDGVPYSIPDGKYTIEIALVEAEERVVAEIRKDLQRDEITRTFMDEEGNYRTYRFVTDSVYENQGRSLHRETKAPCGRDKSISVFRRGTVDRIFAHTIPDPLDCIEELHIDISRNEYGSLHFGLRAERKFDVVSVRVEDLKGPAGELTTDVLTIRAVGELPEVVSLDQKNRTVRVALGPRIIEQQTVPLERFRTQPFWLTMKVRDETRPGEYSGVLVIQAEDSPPARIPLSVRVLPFRLTDTDMQYGMMMDYAFYELDNGGWDEEERKRITQSGDLIYRDLREHGMTLVFPHSHFYFREDSKGEAVLDSLRAGLESYRRHDFPGPFVWYLGHLLQTAKTKHPGSILSYDKQVSKRRLRRLLKNYESIAQELGIAKERLIVQLVDEPDSDQEARVKAGKDLHAVARQMGFRTLITRSWPEVDVICDYGEDAERLHRAGKEWWIYPNATLKSRNPAFSRYVFGFGAWRRGVDGVVPWTFQLTQGSNGNPFNVLDGPEVMVAYPGVDGPVPTPTWEVIREGINDYKYIYLLKQMIAKGKSQGSPLASRIDRQLEKLRNNLGDSPGSEDLQYGEWTAETFEERRKRIVNWALELHGA